MSAEEKKDNILPVTAAVPADVFTDAMIKLNTHFKSYTNLVKYLGKNTVNIIGSLTTTVVGNTKTDLEYAKMLSNLVATVSNATEDPVGITKEATKEIVTPIIAATGDAVKDMYNTVTDLSWTAAVTKWIFGTTPLANRSAATQKQTAVILFLYNIINMIGRTTRLERSNIVLRAVKKTAKDSKEKNYLAPDIAQYEETISRQEEEIQRNVDALGQMLKVTDKFISMEGAVGLEPLLGYIDGLYGSGGKSVFGALHVDSAKITKTILDDVTAFRARDNTLRFARSFPTFKLYFVEEDEHRMLAFDDFYSYSAIESMEVLDSQKAAAPILVLKMSNVTEILTDSANWTENVALKYQGTTDEQQPKSFMLKPGVRLLLKLGFNNNPDKLVTVFMGAATEVNFTGQMLEIVAQGDGAILLEKVGFSEKGETFSAAKGCRTLGDVSLQILDMVPGGKYIGARTLRTAIDNNYDQKVNANERLTQNTIGRLLNLSTLKGLTSFDNPRDHNMQLPISYNPASPVFRFAKAAAITLFHPFKGGFFNKNNWDALLSKEDTFDWVCYKTTAWDALKELCLYSAPNTIVKVFPFNTDGNPFIEKEIRSTVYMGDKHGYYLAADAPKDEEADQIREKVVDLFFNERIKEKFILMMCKLVILGSSETGTRMENQVNIASTVATAGGSWDRFFKSVKVAHVNRNVAFIEEIRQKVGGFGKTTIDMAIEQIASQIREDKELSVLIPLILPSFSNVSGITKEKRTKAYLPSATTLHGELATIFNKDSSNSLLWIAETLLAHLEESFGGFKTAGAQGYGRSDPRPGVIESTVKLYRTTIENYLTAYINSRWFASKIVENQLLVNNTVKGASKEVTDILKIASNVKRVSDTHFLSSFTDIISNNISLTLDEMYNAVVVHFHPRNPEKNTDKLKQTFKIYADDNMPEDKLRIYHYYAPNVDTNVFERLFLAGDWTKENGQNLEKPYEFDNLSVWNKGMPQYYRVATNVLCNSVANMYGGELLIYGNPNIKPYDTCYMLDTSKDMYGPFEVDTVIHIFSRDTGFVTSIKPKALVLPQNLNETINSSYKMRFLWGAAGRAILGAGVKLAPWAFIKSYGANKAVSKFLEEFTTAVTPPKSYGDIPTFGETIEESATSWPDKARIDKNVKIVNSTQTWLKRIYLGWALGSSVWEGCAWYSKKINSMFGREGCNVIPLWHNGLPFTCGLEGALKDDATVSFGNKLYTSNSMILKIFAGGELPGAR